MPRRSLRGAVLAAVLASTILVAAAALSAGGCGDAPETHDPQPRPQSAESARPAVARRIVSLHPAVTEALLALGAGDRIVGLGAWDPGVPGRGDVPRLGDSFQVNLEALVAAEPDVVFCGSQALRDSIEPHAARFRLLSPPVDTLAEAERMVVTAGEAIGADAEAAALVSRMRGAVEAARARAAGRGGRTLRVLVVVERRPLTVAGGRSYVDELLAAVGAVNAARGFDAPWPAVSAEVVPSLAPDVILDAATGGGEPLAAVGGVRVVPAREDCLFRPGPRVGEALAVLERLLFDGAGR